MSIESRLARIERIVGRNDDLLRRLPPPTDNRLESLIATLRTIKANFGESGQAHVLADQALLDYIESSEVDAVHHQITGWDR